MPASLAPESLKGIHLQAKSLASSFRIAFTQPRGRGLAGNWLGVGAGSSIDFQDHRPYLPGDDPRYINWQAYARSGNYTMKLYREEVSPIVDLVFDTSESMWLHPEKRDLAVGLLYFAVEAALAASARVHCFIVEHSNCLPLSLESLFSYQCFADSATSSQRSHIDLSKIPWKSHSMRILISDLLFPGLPNETLRPLARGLSWGAIFCPSSPSESDPKWQGGIRFVDCETEDTQIAQIDRSELEQYQRRYRNHFSLWETQCRAAGMPLFLSSSKRSLRENLAGPGLKSGAIAL